MNLKHKGVRAAVAVAGMAAAMFVTQLAMPGAAHARCIDTDRPETLYLIVDDVTVASETPKTNTCQGNTTYTTTFKSYDPDLKPSLWWQNEARWYSVTGGFNTNSIEVSYSDDNAHTLIHLCVTDRDGDWKCGIDDSYVGGSSVSHLISVVNQGY
jgi:hypothetical protein